ncbi:MAG: DsbE family thiol:disulfide interchange protein [Alphaproteobacteria bacterium]|nr:DsbE family thiol:disulfide interchange protein [Alphaproteobacteria bacterium]
MMKRKTKILLSLVPFVLLAAISAVLAWSLVGNDQTAPVEPPMIGKKLPHFTLTTLDSAHPTFSSHDIKEPFALVNIFATWCTPCRAEHGLLVQLSKLNGIPIYGIAYKDKANDIKAFLSEAGNPYKQVGLDLDGRTGIDLAITGAPETLLVDKEGIIRARIVGPLTPTSYHDQVMSIIKKSH